MVPRGMGGPLSTLCLIIPLAVGWKVLDVNGREASPVQLHTNMSRGFTRGPRNVRQSQVVEMMKHAWNAGDLAITHRQDLIRTSTPLRLIAKYGRTSGRTLPPLLTCSVSSAILTGRADWTPPDDHPQHNVGYFHSWSSACRSVTLDGGRFHLGALGCNIF